MAAKVEKEKVECRFKCGYVGETKNAEKVHATKKHRGQKRAEETSPSRIECRYKCGYSAKTTRPRCDSMNLI